jgi:DNA-binding transcriptional MocR family regulator
VRGTDILMLSDEVYEHMVYDGHRHESVCRHPELAARSFVVSSFGKTYHVTGWKIGYVAAPAGTDAEFRKVHQFNVFTVNTPVQHAIAAFMKDPAPYLELPAFYQRKRDLFREGLAQYPLQAAAVRRHLFPMRGLRRDIGPAGSRVREMADDRDGCGGDTGVGVLPPAQGIGHRALLLRQER